MRTIGYIRVSSDLQDVEKNKADILHFVNDRCLGHVEWITETVSGTVDWRKRALGNVLLQLQPGDTIVTPEISRLARTLKGILEVVEYAKAHEIALHSIKGGWSINDSMESRIVLYMAGMFSEIERDLISQRTIEGLAAKKKAGVKLGRPKGPGKSKLDQFRPEIEALLANGSPKTFIAKRYNVNEITLYNWLRKHNIDAIPHWKRSAS